MDKEGIDQKLETISELDQELWEAKEKVKHVQYKRRRAELETIQFIADAGYFEFLKVDWRKLLKYVNSLPQGTFNYPNF